MQLKKLRTKFPKISVTVLEPSTEKMSIYQETVQQNSSDFTGIGYEWYNQTFQEYMKSTGTKKRYHFISVVHAMYFMGDVKDAVGNLNQLLEPGGMMMIILNTGKLFLTGINLGLLLLKSDVDVTEGLYPICKPFSKAHRSRGGVRHPLLGKEKKQHTVIQYAFNFNYLSPNSSYIVQNAFFS